MTPQSRRAPSYGRTTRTLHWLTAVALVVQFTLGYVLDVGGNGRGRGRGRGGEFATGYSDGCSERSRRADDRT